MNSPSAPAGRTGRAARRAPVTRLHRATQVVLVVGSVLAVLAAAGPLWVVRAGLVVAVATSVVTCVLAWRELAAARRTHAAGVLAADRRHGDVLRTERTRNAEVVDTLAERLRSTAMVVAGQRGAIAMLQNELGTVTTERDRLGEQVAERDGLIGLFRASLREQETALLAVREAERVGAPLPSASEGAEVHALPRRSRPADVLDPVMEELAMVLPNYEATRRVG